MARKTGDTHERAQRCKLITDLYDCFRVTLDSAKLCGPLTIYQLSQCANVVARLAHAANQSETHAAPMQDVAVPDLANALSALADPPAPSTGSGAITPSDTTPG